MLTNILLISPNRLRISFTNNDNESLIIIPFRVQI